MHFNWLLSTKAYFKDVFRHTKFGSHFFPYRSLQLSTIVLNDKILIGVSY